MKNILKSALPALISGLVAAIVVVALVGDQSVLGASGTRFPRGISADSTSPSTGQVRGTTLTATGDVTADGFVASNTGTSTLNLSAGFSCLTLKATNGSTTAFVATSSTSGLVQVASCE